MLPKGPPSPRQHSFGGADVGDHDPLATSYRTAEVRSPLVSAQTTNTSPFNSAVAIRQAPAPAKGATDVHVPDCGSYSSADRRSGLSVDEPGVGSCTCVTGPPSTPPTTRTLPPDSRAAVGAQRPSFILPVAVQVPVTGSYSSASRVAR